MEKTVPQKTQPSKEWQELNKEFENLCKEQDKLYKQDFEKVFKALCEIDSKQQEIYNTNDWNMGINLPDEADIPKIQQALKQTGFSNDEAFCKDFIRYANVVIEGKKNMQKRVILNLNEEMERYEKEHKKETQPDEWQFKHISIIAPQELHPIIEDMQENNAKAGKGLFENKTDIEFEDEEIDKLLMIDAFGLKCSFVPFLDELKRYEVAGKFLNNLFLKTLFQALNKEATFIKDNTDKPAKVKNHITDTLKFFDKMPIWGLFFQILILQGLCRWLEGININEDDNGYNEAQSLYTWLCGQLIKKEINFCFVPYGNEDKEILKPLSRYLYSTEIGQIVQNNLFPKQQPQANDYNTNTLPTELQTDKAKQLFQKAIKAGIITQENNLYKWNFGQYTGQLLAYFCQRASHYLDLSKRLDKNGNKTVSWKVFEKAFNVKNIISYKNNWLKCNTKFTPNGFKEIEKLFDI